MARKVIANLATLLTADATQFAAEFKRADNVARRMSGSIRKTLAKPVANLSFGLLGAGSATALLTREIGYVVQNIERIPGIPEDVVASVERMRYKFREMREETQKWTAHIAAAVTDAMTGLHHQFILNTQGADAAALAFGRWAESLKDARRATPEFAASLKSLAEAQDRLNNAGKSPGLKLSEELRTLESAYAQFQASTISEYTETLADVKERTNVTLRLAKAREDLAKLTAKHAEAEREAGRAMQFATGASLSLTEQSDALKASLAGIQVELAKLDDIGDSAVLEQRIELYKRMTAEAKQLQHVTDEQRRGAQALAGAFENSFESAIFEGEKLRDVLKNLGNELAKMAIRAWVIRPLSKMFGDSFDGLTGGFFGGPRANGGPVSSDKSYLVGERGPELFVPDTAGRVIPAERTAAMVGGGAGGDTNVFNIDARGADVAAVARLEAMVRELHGTFERRAVAAIGMARMRGGAVGRALA